MHGLDTRVAVLTLSRKGHGVRAVARALGLSRNTVRRILRSGQAEVPRIERREKASPYESRILELYAECKGNLVRVHEELAADGVELSYAALTAYCRRHGIGVRPKEAVGSYHFDPGEEMQHDTSPHRVQVGGQRRLLQCAALVLCYSRMLFAQCYPRFNRFYCKAFVTAALRFFGGACRRAMVDNTSVVIAHGTGKEAVPAPEMAAFAERFGFHFEAHAVGDANRSARVERPFHYIENNFYPGRHFEDLTDLNAQLVAWCQRSNSRHRRHLQAAPVELFQRERLLLRPLPLHVPEVYQLHNRLVDLEGYVTVHTNRYSVPTALIDRRVQVRETLETIRVFDGHRLVAEHERKEDGGRNRVTLEAHREERRQQRQARRRTAAAPLPEESTLRAAGEEFAAMLAALKKDRRRQIGRTVRQLHRLYLEYPTDALRQALRVALDYGLHDLDRIEQMTLRNIAGSFFQLPRPTAQQAPEEEDTHER